MAGSYRKLVIKIGSNVLTRPDGLPDLHRMSKLTNEIAGLKNKGIQIVVVSSGAVAAGKSLIQVKPKSDVVAARQLLASVGQVQLINTYSELFRAHKLLCSQVLVTKDDFRSNEHKRNMVNCFNILLQHDIIPVVNENDVISITELMFTDNDELAGLIAAMIMADALLILTNVDGLYDGDPANQSSAIIEEVDPSIDFSGFITTSKSNFGRGGMLTKSSMASKTAKLGIAVHICNGTRDGIIHDVLNGQAVHTRFVPNKKLSGQKIRIARTDAVSGVVQVNKGAKLALTGSKASSLLPVGVIFIQGEFKKKDIIRITDEEGKPIGLGIAEYGSEKAIELIGQKNQKPLVHYDYLYLSQETH